MLKIIRLIAFIIRIISEIRSRLIPTFGVLDASNNQITKTSRITSESVVSEFVDKIIVSNRLKDWTGFDFTFYFIENRASTIISSSDNLTYRHSQLWQYISNCLAFWISSYCNSNNKIQKISINLLFFIFWYCYIFKCEKYWPRKFFVVVRRQKSDLIEVFV